MAIAESRWPGPDVLTRNETHLGQRPSFQRAGRDLDDSLYGGAKRVLRRAVLGAVPAWFVPFAFALVPSLGRPSAFLILSFALPLVWFVLALTVPQTEILDAWHILLDDKAEISDTAYGVIFQSLRDGHGIPADMRPKRVRVGPPVRGVRNMLRIQLGRYATLVSVFPFGNDLYLGWTLSRRQVPLLIVLPWLSPSGADRGFPGPTELEPIKAIREAVHSAVHEGMESALAGRYIPIVETFGYDVPVEAVAPAPAVVGAAGAEPRPVTVTVLRPVEVFAVEDREQVIGQAHPGVSYELVGEDGGTGLVVRDSSGSVALVKDPSAVRRE
ncbi:MAG TPA: hypothetical protein VJT49_25960 [Amycolatopsis sp.]|uniref:hypothetical protein n=1 Tax=Amycolatopsis sp. TaxID=37632 RepID=UPI002B479A2B|nr:hypothetical protein [Amycolatopsis sp.]HKS48494.1 hypothetical protein [Amycolatopsis sp.]